MAAHATFKAKLNTNADRMLIFFLCTEPVRAPGYASVVAITILAAFSGIEKDT